VLSLLLFTQCWHIQFYSCSAK